MYVWFKDVVTYFCTIGCVYLANIVDKLISSDEVKTIFGRFVLQQASLDSNLQKYCKYIQKWKKAYIIHKLYKIYKTEL